MRSVCEYVFGWVSSWIMHSRGCSVSRVVVRLNNDHSLQKINRALYDLGKLGALFKVLLFWLIIWLCCIRICSDIYVFQFVLHHVRYVLVDA